MLVHSVALHYHRTYVGHWWCVNNMMSVPASATFLRCSVAVCQWFVSSFAIVQSCIFGIVIVVHLTATSKCNKVKLFISKSAFVIKTSPLQFQNCMDFLKGITDGRLKSVMNFVTGIFCSNV